MEAHYWEQRSADAALLIDGLLQLLGAAMHASSRSVPPVLLGAAAAARFGIVLK